MADAVTSQTILDGEKNVVMKFTNISDSTGESAVTKVDFSTLSGAYGEVKIKKIQAMTKGLAVQVLWDATANVVALEIPEDCHQDYCFERIGGLVNTSGAGKTGDVLFTTVGAAAGDSYSIVLHMEKRGQA